MLAAAKDGRVSTAMAVARSYGKNGDIGDAVMNGIAVGPQAGQVAPRQFALPRRVGPACGTAASLEA
jgi:hypothetical protein